MNADVTSLDTLLNLQGDTVLTHKGEQEWFLTFVHVVDVGGRSLRLVNRVAKGRKPDWPVSQALLNAVHPAPPNAEGAKWELRLKA